MIKIYNKLVRDKIPEIIAKNGSIPVSYKIKDDEELRKLLIEKLREEVEEYCESLNPEELADILEVMHTLSKEVHNRKFVNIENMREFKKNEIGGFKDRIFLERVVYEK